MGLLYEKYAYRQMAEALGKNHESGLTTELLLEPLTDIYLHSDLEHQVGRTGDIQYVYIMSVIARFILLIACINFINLTTAAWARRAKEVGNRRGFRRAGASSEELFVSDFGEVSFRYE